MCLALLCVDITNVVVYTWMYRILCCKNCQQCKHVCESNVLITLQSHLCQLWITGSLKRDVVNVMQYDTGNNNGLLMFVCHFVYVYVYVSLNLRLFEWSIQFNTKDKTNVIEHSNSRSSKKAKPAECSSCRVYINCTSTLQIVRYRS